MERSGLRSTTGGSALETPPDGSRGSGRGGSRADGADAPDREAITAIWREHRRWLAAVIYAHMPRGADLDDLLQETAMRLVAHYHQLSDPSAIRPWLRTVAVNTARSAGRKQRVRQIVSHGFETGHLESLATTGPALRSDAGAPTRGERALDLARSLPPHYREPLLLSLRGLSQRQIADALDLPLTTIETRLIRARRIIRDELVRDDSGTGGAVEITATASNPSDHDQPNVGGAVA